MTTPPTAASWDGVLVRFGEIGLKSSPVRMRMLRRLRSNLLDQMLRAQVEGDVELRGSRVWMVGPDGDKLLEVATRTFGVVSASPVRKVAPTLEAVCAAAPLLALAVARPWTSFAIRARRDGQHTFSSQDVAIQAGSAVHKAATAAGRKPKVDLGKPDLEVHIDVRPDAAYLFLEDKAGPGGIPTATQGKVACALRTRNDALAAWLMLRRGCAVAPADGPDPRLVAHLRLWGLSKSLGGSVAEAAGHWHAAATCSGATLSDPDALAPSPPGLPRLLPLLGLDPEERALWMRRSGLADVALAAGA
jgi:thiamine biosynthesis protein ThiI